MNNDKTKKTIIIIVAIVLVLGVIAWLIMTIVPSMIIMNISQEQVLEDAQNAQHEAEIAHIKDTASLLMAKNILKEVEGVPMKTPVKELEKLINDELLKEFGQGYTVTLSEDYKITYNFEIE